MVIVVSFVCLHCRRILVDTNGAAIVLSSGATINHRVTIRCVCGVERTFYPPNTSTRRKRLRPAERKTKP